MVEVLDKQGFKGRPKREQNAENVTLQVKNLQTDRIKQKIRRKEESQEAGIQYFFFIKKDELRRRNTSQTQNQTKYCIINQLIQIAIITYSYA